MPPQDSQKDESRGFFDHTGVRSFIHKTIKTSISVACGEQIIGPGNPDAEEVDYCL
jgi:hypothetical protein